MAENKTAAENRNVAKIKTVITLCVCLLIAFGMWVYVMTVESPDHEQLFSGITVELTGNDALAGNNLAVFSGYGVKLDVTLSGKKSIMSKLTTDDIVVTADLSSLTESGRYSLKPSVDVPAGCKLVGLSQNTVSVYVDSSAQIVVDLSEVRENTDLPEGCFTGEIDLNVDKVTVTGPLNLLSKISEAIVNIDMSNITKTTTITEKIELVDLMGSVVDNPYIDYYPKDVTVEIPVLKTVRVPVEVEFKNGFLSYESTDILIDPEFVDVTGDAELIDKSECIKPVVIDEKSALDGGRYSSVVTLECADGLLPSTRKAKVSVMLKPSYSIREYTVPADNVSPIGAAEVDFTWREIPINVELLGRSDIFSKIKDDDLSFVFDLSPYSSTNTGTVRIKADLSVPDEYRDYILQIGTYYVDVTFGSSDD